jgi:hypothetical protein
LQVAIEQGLTILSWHENLSKDEIPPERLWEDSEGLEQWWARVEEKRESGMPVNNQRSTSDGANASPQGAEVVDNDLARALKQG